MLLNPSLKRLPSLRKLKYCFFYLRVDICALLVTLYPPPPRTHFFYPFKPNTEPRDTIVLIAGVPTSTDSSPLVEFVIFSGFMKFLHEDGIHFFWLLQIFLPKFLSSKPNIWICLSHQSQFEDISKLDVFIYTVFYL